MTRVCWSPVCRIWKRTKFVKSYSVCFFSLCCCVLRWKQRKMWFWFLWGEAELSTFPLLSLYLLSWMPVLSECLSPLFLSLLSVLMCWLLPVAASLWWRQSPCIVYLRLAALPAEYINRGRRWSVSDWTGISSARPLSFTNSPPAPGCLKKPSIQAATSLSPIKSSCNHGKGCTCMSHALIKWLTRLLSCYFITPDVHISQMYKWACEWIRPIKPSIKQRGWLHSQNSLTHIFSTSYIKSITAFCLWPFNWWAVNVMSVYGLQLTVRGTQPYFPPCYAFVNLFSDTVYQGQSQTWRAAEFETLKQLNESRAN